MAIKIAHGEDGGIIAVDTENSKKVADISTMESLMSEVEEKRKLREKAMELLEKQKHPSE